MTIENQGQTTVIEQQEQTSINCESKYILIIQMPNILQMTPCAV